MGDQSFSDAEEHDCNLGNRKEAPDGGLFHEIRGDQASEIRAENEKEDALDNHSLLFMEGEERGEHKEGMDSGAGNNVSGVGHWYGPSEMVVSSVCAKLFASKPFGRRTDQGLFPYIGDEKSGKQHSSSNKTELFDDHVTVNVFLVLGERGVDYVTKIWLQTDVKESQYGQDLIDYCITDG